MGILYDLWNQYLFPGHQYRLPVLWGSLCTTDFVFIFSKLDIVSSVQFSRSVVSDSLQPHELQHARPPCPSPAPGVQTHIHRVGDAIQPFHPLLSEGLKHIRTYQKRGQAFSPCKDSLCRSHQCPSASCRGAFSDEDIYSIDPYSWSHQWIFNTPLTASANHMVFQMLSILSSNITRKINR